MSPTLALVLGALAAPRRPASSRPAGSSRAPRTGWRGSGSRREGESFRLLTRADLVTGRYRRLPGILGLTGDRLVFEGLFGESAQLATSRIQKIETGRRLASGRLLLRLEVLRITPASGGADRVRPDAARPPAPGGATSASGR